MKIGLGIGIPATSSGMSILQQLQNIPGGGLTFFKDYRPNAPSLNADFSVGSNAATYSAARSASAPSTYTDSNGIIQLLTTADVRRWKGGYCDDTGFHLQSGEMIEAAGTNLVQDSYTSLDISTYWVAGAGSISSSSTYQNIYGGGNVIKFLASNIDDRFSNAVAKRPNTISGTIYTFSVYLRGSGDVYLWFAASGGSNQFSSKITLSNSEWRRYSFAFTSDASAPTLIGLRLQENNSVTIYATGFQLEASPYATSFIPTTTAALTRAAEVLKYATSGNRTAASETIYLKVSQIYSGSEVTGYPPVMTTDTKERKIYISKDTDSYQFEPNATDSSSCDVASSTDPTKNVSYVLAVVAHGETSDVNASIYVNGSLENTDSDNYTSPGWGTYMYFGSGEASTGQSGILLQSVAIFSGAHDAATVAAVTNILNAGGL